MGSTTRSPRNPSPTTSIRAGRPDLSGPSAPPQARPETPSPHPPHPGLPGIPPYPPFVSPPVRLTHVPTGATGPRRVLGVPIPPTRVSRINKTCSLTCRWRLTSRSSTVGPPAWGFRFVLGGGARSAVPPEAGAPPIGCHLLYHDASYIDASQDDIKDGGWLAIRPWRIRAPGRRPGTGLILVLFIPQSRGILSKTMPRPGVGNSRRVSGSFSRAYPVQAGPPSSNARSSRSEPNNP